MVTAITNNLNLWASALLTKSTAGRGNNGKQEAYGIKKLRELILELAVRGKLVPQNPSDEPATELLKQVATEKARMVREKQMTKGKDFSAIADDEIPFDLPSRWEWARINDVGHNWGQKTPDDDFTYIDVSAIDNTLGVICEPSVLSHSDAPSRARKIVKKGTVIYSTVRPYLKNICVIEEDYSPEPIASTAFAILHPFQDMPGKFFALYLRSPEFVKYVESVQTGIAYPAINDKQFYGGLVPIPPLAEQHRIVAKVDELMELCNQLEQQQTHSIVAHQILVEALLGTLTRVESQQELVEAWICIANHFDILFTTEHSIDQLKQTILQLAVIGKLVPQDPNDEPANVQLEKIVKVRRQLIKKRLIREQKALPEIGEEEKPFPIQQGWEWVRVGNYIEVNRGASPRPKGDPRYFATERTKYHWVKIGDLRLHGRNNVLYDTEEFLTKEGSEKSVLAPKGTLVITNSATIGVPIVMGIDGYIHDGFLSFPYFPRDFLLREFFLLGLQSLSSHLIKEARGLAQLNMNSGIMKNAPIAIPPLAEQHRIVAKVDELMALCDGLRGRLAEAQTTQIHLADAIVERAVA